MSNEKQQFITRADSQALYGIGILLMVFHHCFSFPNRLRYPVVTLLLRFETLSRLSWSGKLCVAVFAFVSGYAFASMAAGLRENRPGPRLRADLRLALRQLGRFYGRFWLVFAVYVPIGILFFDAPRSPICLLRGLFFGEFYNAEWWYVAQYLLFVPVFLLLDLCFSRSGRARRGVLALAGACVLLICLLARDSTWGHAVRSFAGSMYFDYILCFAAAFLIRRYQLFIRLDRRLHLPAWACLLGIAALLTLRCLLVKSPVESRFDPLLTPPLAYLSVCLLHREKAAAIGRFLRFFGRYSTWMWLTHTFWLYHYFPKIALFPRCAPLVYVWVVLLALGNGLVFDFMHSRIRKF